MNNALAYAFAAGTLAILVLSAFYVALRLRHLLHLQRRVPTFICIVLVLVATLTVTGIAPRSTSAWVGALYVGSGYIFYFYLNLVLALLLEDAAERLIRLPAQWSLWAALSVAVTVTVVGVNHARSFSVVRTQIGLAELKRPVTLAHLSDVHLGYHRGRDYLDKLVDAINRGQPDAVVITGDLVDSNVALQAAVLEPLSRMKAPVYYVEGNHEAEVDTELLLQRLRSNRVHVLHNQVVDLGDLQLIGLDYMNADEQAFNMHPSILGPTINTVLPTLALHAGKPAVLLHHSPAGLSYAESKGIALMLAGHTHGGQIFPFNWLTLLLFPFNEGLYERGATQIYVSPGAGTFLIPARLGTSNQVAFLSLRPN